METKTFTQKCVLVCPLNWGLGHATRCIPIIRILLAQGHRVLIGANGRSRNLLEIEFPDLTYVSLPDYNIRYPESGAMSSRIMIQLPRLLKTVFAERAILKGLIKKYDIDFIISDNRFGLYSKKIPSIYITHQISIIAPKKLKWAEPLIQMLHKLVMKNFHQVWIPDYQKAPTLSGSLSHSDISPDSRVYVGPLSRFCNNPRIPKDVVAKEFIIDVKLPDNIDILVIISGPEPQRTIFEKILFEQLKTRKENVLILRGTPEENAGFKLSESVFVTNHLPTEQLEPIFKKAGVIIARSGYSTIMDLAATGKKAILVPTPGQTEQEYLAHRLMANGIFYSDSQNRINLDKALKEAYVFKGINTIEADSESLEEVIANVVKMELS